MARIARVYHIPPDRQQRLTLLQFRLLQSDYNALEQEGG